MSLTKKTLSGSTWIGLSIGIASICQFIQLALLARVLGPTDMGVIALSVVVTSFIDIFVTMGISNAIIQRKDISKQELQSLFWLNLLFGTIGAALVSLVAPSLESFYSMPGLTQLLHFIAVVFLVTSCSQVSRGVLEKNMDFKGIALGEILQAVVTATLAVLLASSHGPTAFGIGLLAGHVVRTLLFVWLARRSFFPKFHFCLHETQRFIAFGIYQALDSVVTFISNNIASALIGRIVSSGQLGKYNISYTIAVNTPAKLNSVMTRVLFPALSLIREDHDKFNRKVATLLEVAGYLSVPTLGLVAIHANELLLIFLGKDWADAAPLLQILCLVGIGRAFANPVGIVLMAVDKMRLGFWVNMAKSILTVTLVVAGILLYGTKGVAWAYTVMAVVTIAVNWVLFKRLLGMSSQTFFRAHLLPLAIFVPSGVITGAITLLRGNSVSLIGLLVSLAIGAFSYLVTLLIVQHKALFPLLGQLAGKNLKQ